MLRPSSLSFLRMSAAIVGVLTCVSTTSFASGSYAGGPPPVPKVDATNSQYEVGQAIYLGNVQLPAPNPATTVSQQQTLKGLEDQLAKAGVTKDLSSFSGRLNDAQLFALKVFLTKRYGVTATAQEIHQ